MLLQFVHRADFPCSAIHTRTQTNKQIKPDESKTATKYSARNCVCILFGAFTLCETMPVFSPRLFWFRIDEVFGGRRKHLMCEIILRHECVRSKLQRMIVNILLTEALKKRPKYSENAHMSTLSARTRESSVCKQTNE